MASAAEVLPDAQCLECHGDKDLAKDLPDGSKRSLFVDVAKFRASAHGKTHCVGCHTDLTGEHPAEGATVKRVDCAACHEPQSHSFGMSVHGLAAVKSGGKAATCADCHGTHDMLPRNAAGSAVHAANLTNTCGGCHRKESEDVAASVHGQATAAGEVDAATCIDCHAEHKITGLRDPAASYQTAVACSKCHASERINSRFSMPGDRVKTFFESYHGLAATGGSATAANCASCHGYHRILRSGDPASTIHPANLVQTCGKCHPGSTQGFVGGKIHAEEAGGDQVGMVVNHWVKLIYRWLIGLTVGVLGLHNLVAWWRKVAARRRLHGEWVIRMNRNERAQHLVLMASFIILAVTGFALKFPGTWWARLLGTEEIRRWSHRIAGIALLGCCCYHVYHVLFTVTGRRLLRDLWPRWRDLRDLAVNLRYLARGGKKAAFGRFGYPEKLEYWAVVWGTVVMGATGLFIWFKVEMTHWLPRWAVDVAVTVHYYEAILACLAIIIWHFYHVMFDPDVYPMNFAWLDGKVPKKWHDEEHSLDTSGDVEK